MEDGMIQFLAEDCLLHRRFFHGLARTHRPTMGGSQQAPSPAQTGPKGRPALGRRPRLLRGHPLDSLDRRTMERAAVTIWEEEHRPSSAGTMDQRWDAGEALACFLAQL